MADYNAKDYADYEIADAPDDLDWHLLQSRNAETSHLLLTFISVSSNRAR